MLFYYFKDNYKVIILIRSSLSNKPGSVSETQTILKGNTTIPHSSTPRTIPQTKAQLRYVT